MREEITLVSTNQADDSEAKIRSARINRRTFSLLCVGAAVSSPLLWCRCTRALASTGYPETVATLRYAHDVETTAYYRYVAYGRQADLEEYAGIAYLFAALATSELIHAQNYNRVLSTLGFKGKAAEPADLPVSNTKDNLADAANKEINSIEKTYPAILKRLESEKLRDAILNTQYAWASHRQHRDLVKKIQRWSPSFFERVARRIDEESGIYYVCQICGSTLNRIPESTCPICKNPASHYRQINAG